MRSLSFSIILLFILGSQSLYSYEIATYKEGKLILPFFQLGKQVYTDIVLQLSDDLFKIKAVGDITTNTNSIISRFDKKSNVVQIDYMATGENTYRDLLLQVTKKPTRLREIGATALFDIERTQIYTPAEYYPPGNNVTLQMVAVADFNQDGRQDIAAHYWHNKWDAPDFYYGEVSNNLVIYLQNDDRTFRVANEELFGMSTLDLGGNASRKQIVADFNGDGYPDIAYAMNREDGRPGNVNEDNENTWDGHPVVVMSNGDGTYRLDQLPEYKKWYHAITAVKNDLGSYDILVQSDNQSSGLGLRNFNDQWESIDDYPPMGNWSLQSYEDVIFSDMSDGLGFIIYQKNGVSWETIASIDYSDQFSNEEVLVQGWNGQKISQRFIDIFGKKRISTAFAETCILNDGELFLAQFDNRVMPDDWENREFLVEMEMDLEKPFLLFTIEDHVMVLNDSLMPIQDAEIHSYRFECGDKTADGLDDVFVINRDGTSTLYVQDTDGHFERFGNRLIPLSMSYNPLQIRGIYTDLDGDNILDIVSYSNTPSTFYDGVSEFLEYPLEVQWGSHPLFDGQ